MAGDDDLIDYTEEPPNLQELCFGVIYENLVSKVTSTTSDFVRGLMDDHLVGKVKKAVR